MTVDSAAGQLLINQVNDLGGTNRHIHLDAALTNRRADDTDLPLGPRARQTADRRNSGRTGWMVLYDVQGNPFCVARSEANRLDTFTRWMDQEGRTPSTIGGEGAAAPCVVEDAGSDPEGRRTVQWRSVWMVRRDGLPADRPFWHGAQP